MSVFKQESKKARKPARKSVFTQARKPASKQASKKAGSIFDSAKASTPASKPDSQFENSIFAGMKGNSKINRTKQVGRPKIKQVDGCTIEDSWSGTRHVYTMFGKPQECCTKCGKPHEMITEWRMKIAEGSQSDWEHPYVREGYWSSAEYKKYMSR